MPPTRNPRRDHAHDLPAIPGLAALNTGLGNESASHPDTPSPARRSEHTARAHPATPPTSRSPTMQTCMNNTECLGLLTIVRTISDPTNGSGGGVGRRASPVGSVFKKATIISDFRKCGLGPIDESAVPRELFEPVLNYTTQAAQPLPPCLPSLLIPIATDATSTMTTTRSSTASSSTATSHPSATSGNASGSGTPPNLSAGSSPSSASLSATSSHLSATVPRPSTPPRPSDATHAEEVVQALYKIAVPSPLHKTASRKALAAENDQLRKIALAAGVELEKNHVQMILMDNENGCLCQQLHAKKNKEECTYTTGHAQLMTSDEMQRALLKDLHKKQMEALIKLMRTTKFPAIKTKLAEEAKAVKKIIGYCTIKTKCSLGVTRHL